MTVSAPTVASISIRSVPLKLEAYFLTISFSCGRRRRRGSSSTAGDPGWVSIMLASCFDWAGVGGSSWPPVVMVVKKMGTPAARAASRTRAVLSTTESRSVPREYRASVQPIARSMTITAGRAP